MFTELSLANFKSWKRIDKMRLGKITGLFGTNSSGKSSIIQLLLLLKQTAESKDQKVPLQLGDDRSYVNLGDFGDVVHNGDLDAAIEFRLRLDLGHLQSVENDLGEVLLGGNFFDISSEVGLVEHLMETLKVEVFFSGETFTVDGGVRQEGVDTPLFHSSDKIALTPAVRQPKTPLEKLGKAYALPSNLPGHFPETGFLDHLIYTFEEELKETLYLGPLREPPSRQYGYRNTVPSDVGVRGEKAVEALVASRFDKRLQGEYSIQNTSLEVVIAKKLVELGLLVSFELREVNHDENAYKVMVRRDPGSAEVLITDVGFGVSQVFPVLVLCYYAPRGSTIVIEQPELHLHPNVQSKLADIFIDVMKHRGLQVIIESHSEHLLRRMQRRIAEECLDPEDVSLYFCEQENGESKLRQLDVDPYGNIRNWPEDFFGDEFAEMAAMTKAAMDRKDGKSK
ncbi:Predicted ATPase [Neorhodopirellula lusitana]|uniref:Predicted ATPase n=1 Tax=Neorhodopirellula lusitana TaxID=445327 RepID=A0ABY1Q6P4_9BACT|nr:DUF3696 domain-containing protein [Neorhodopirellula lusitana]SMP61408.1 Predicted ATPase [Neorhodopirellula lusitana]